MAFASVALEFPDHGAQLDEGVKKHHLRSAAIGGHVNGGELSNPKFDPFWKKAKERGCLVFTHTQGGRGGRTNVIGNPLETTNFPSHLIFDRTLDRFPGLTICAAHVGGYLLPGASDNGCNRFPEGSKIKKHPTEYSRQIYVDSIYSLLRDCATLWPSAVSVR